MTIYERIKEYLYRNFDNRIMLKTDNGFQVYERKDYEKLIRALVDLFMWWSIDNEEEKYNDNPIALFEYCVNEAHSFGDICVLYYEDASGDFVYEKFVVDLD